jgi:O-antigen/teichoic acid export membrane protein
MPALCHAEGPSISSALLLCYRWSVRMTRGTSSDRRLSFQVGLVVVSRFLSAVVDLLGTVVLVRLLAKDDFGALALLLVLHATVGMVLQIGLHQSVLYFIPTLGPGAKRTLAYQTVRILAVMGLIAAGAAMLLGLGLGDRFLGGRSDLSGLVPLVALALLLDFPARAHQQTLMALDRHDIAAYAGVVLSVGSLVAIALPAALGLPLPTVVTSWALFAAVRLAVGIGVPAIAFRGVRPEPFPGGMSAQLRYAFPLGLASVVGIVNVQLDKFLVAGLFGAAVFAEYAVAARELPLVSILPYTVAAAILPRLSALAANPAEGGPAAAVALWHDSIRRVALIMLPVAAFLLATAEAVVVLLYTDSYEGATPVFRLYLAILPLRVTAYGVMTQALGRPKDTFRGAIIGLTTNAVVSIALIAPLGVLGPPAGTLASQVVAVAFFLYVIGAATGLSLRSVFPWRAYGRTLVVSALSAAPLPFLLHTTGLSPGPALALAAAAFLPLYVLLAKASGLLGPEELAYIMSWLRLEPLRGRR